MFDHPHARMLAGMPQKQFVPRPVQPVPLLSEEGDGANARRVIDVLTGKPTPTTPKEAFSILFQELQKDLMANTDLIGELEAVRQRFVERIQSQRASARAALEAQHSDVYQRCRITFDQVSVLRDRLNAADTALNLIDQRLGAARADTRNAEGARPGPYPSQVELQVWMDDCARVKAKQVEIENEHEAAVIAGRKIAAALRAAMAELGELQGQEQNLSDRLKGKASTGPHGIIQPPEELGQLE